MRLAKIKSEFNPTQEKNRIINEMELIYNDFINSIDKFVESWYRNQFNRYTDLLAVQYENLTDEQKYELEDLIDKLIAENKVIAKNYFTNKDIWWHKNQNLSLNHDFYKSIDNLIDDKFRNILGEIGKVLNEYEFIPKFYDTPMLGFLCHKDENNIYRFRYVDPIFWSREMKTELDNYWEKYKYIINVLDENERKKSA